MSYRIDTEDNGQRFFVSEDGRFKIPMDGTPFEHFTFEQMVALIEGYLTSMQTTAYEIAPVSAKTPYFSNRASRREKMKKKGR